MINVVCAVIFDGESRVLACQRAIGGSLGGMWEFPGGKVEANEDAREALVREIDEELGCAIRVDDELPGVVHDYGQMVIRLRAFTCRIISGKPEALEHEAIRWVDDADARLLNWAEADIPILEYISEEHGWD